MRNFRNIALATALGVTGFSASGAVHRVCLSASGSGYNWSSTMSWMAESINYKIDSAEPGDLIDLNCVIGSSSSGAFIGMISALKQNYQLFPYGSMNDPLSLEDAKKFAKSMNYLAFATDMSINEISGYSTTRGMYDKGLGWWNGTYRAHKILLDFSSRIMLAYNLTDENVALMDRFEDLPKQYSIDDLKSYMGEAADSTLTSMESHVGWASLETFADRIRRDSQKIILDLYDQADAKIMPRTEDVAHFGEDPTHPVRMALNLPMPDGFFTTSFIDLAISKSPTTYTKDVLEAPKVRDLRTIVIGNEESIRKLVEGNFYQTQVLFHKPFDQFVFATATKLLDAVPISLSEPDLNKAYVRTFNPRSSDNLHRDFSSGLTYIYDPRLDILDSVMNFKMEKGFKPVTGPKGDKGRLMIGVVGGWPDGKLSAQALGFYAAMDNRASSTLFSVKTRESTLSGFAHQKIGRYFAGENGAEDSIAYLEGLTSYWFDYQKSLANYLTDSVEYEHIKFNWDFPHYPENKGLVKELMLVIDAIVPFAFMHRPAAIKRQAHYQVTHTINGIRVQRGQVESHGLFFDRAFYSEPAVYKMDSE